MSGTHVIAVIIIGVVLAIVFLRRERPRRVGGGSEPAAGPARPARSTRPAPPRPATPERASFPPAGAFAGLSSEDLAEVAQALLGGRKIEAIKLVRERTGMGLKEAKEFVEGLDPGKRG